MATSHHTRRAYRPLLVVALAAAACSSNGAASLDAGSTTSAVDTSTTPTLSVSTTTTLPPPELASPDEALAFVVSFDPASEDATGLAVALAMIGSHFPGLPTADLVERGSSPVRQAVFDMLARPSAQNAQILVAMDTYGAPSGSPQEPVRWDPIARVGITTSLETALGYFDTLAPVAVGVHREVLADQLARCDASGCPWPGAFYDPPIVVTTLDGDTAGDVFTGSIGIRAGTDLTAEHAVVMERVLDQWVIIEGYLAEARPPALVITDPPNGSVSSEAIIPVSGVSEEGVVVSAQGDSFEIDLGQFWQVAVTLEPGWNDITVIATAPSGETSVARIRLRFEPSAVRQLGFLVEMTETTVTFDPAAMLFGPEADQAAREDGAIAEGETLPGGFYVSNPDRDEVTLSVAADFRAVLLSVDSIDPSPASPAEFRRFLEAGGVAPGLYAGDPATTPYWLTSLDGTVIQIEQQYLP